MSRIFLRHGEAIHNVDERFYRYGDDTLLTLTPKGFQDAVNYAPALVRHLKDREVNTPADGYVAFRMISSDSIRAKQTASVLHTELVNGEHAHSFLQEIMPPSPDNLRLRTEMKVRPIHTVGLREFYYDDTRTHYEDHGILSGGFDYAEFQKSIDYQRGVSVSFRELTSRLSAFLRWTNQIHKVSSRSLHINISHHYAIAAAVAAYLVQEDGNPAQNDAIMKVCQDTYIHKGLVYDLADLDIGSSNSAHAGKEPVPSALWAGLIAAGIDSCYPVKKVHYECAQLYTEAYGDLPERYKPKNRVSDN